jgi:hypothetical protein
MKIANIVARSMCLPSQSFQNFCDTLLGVRARAMKWTQKGHLRLWMDAKKYKEHFSQLFDEMEASTRELMLAFSADGRVQATEEFQKAMQERDQILRQVEELGRKTEQTNRMVI